MMSTSALAPASCNIVSWWSRDPTGIVQKHPKIAEFTRKTAEIRAKRATSGFAVADLL
jgi:hypothetical protein